AQAAAAAGGEQRLGAPCRAAVPPVGRDGHAPVAGRSRPTQGHLAVTGLRGQAGGRVRGCPGDGRGRDGDAGGGRLYRRGAVGDGGGRGGGPGRGVGGEGGVVAAGRGTVS